MSLFCDTCLHFSVDLFTSECYSIITIKNICSLSSPRHWCSLVIYARREGCTPMTMKQIKCPACGSRLLDASSNAAAETTVFLATDAAANSRQPDYLVKCRKCNTILGLKRGPKTNRISTEHDAWRKSNDIRAWQFPTHGNCQAHSIFK